MDKYLLEITLCISKVETSEKNHMNTFVKSFDEIINNIKLKYKDTPIKLICAEEDDFFEKNASKIIEKYGGTVESIQVYKDRYCQGYISVNSKGEAEIEFKGVSSRDIFGNKKWIVEKENKEIEFIKRIDRFNQDVKKYLPKSKNMLEKSMDYLMKKEDRNNIPENVQNLMQHYAAADVLSLHYQQWKMKSMKMIYALGLGSIIMFLVYHLLESKFMLLFYILFFAVAYAVYFFSRKKEMEIKYLDYRALAEGLRVQIFWSLAGLNDDITDYYLYEQKNELIWIENAIRTLNLKIEKCKEKLKNYEHVLKYWIEDQHLYYKGAVIKNEIKLRRNKKIVEFLVTATFLISIFLIYSEYFTNICTLPSNILKIIPEGIREVLFPRFEEILEKNWILLGMEVIAAGAAVFENFIETTALREQVKRYSRMLELFEGGNKHIGEALNQNKYDAADDYIRALGKECLIENGEWILLYRERPIKIPKK